VVDKHSKAAVHLDCMRALAAFTVVFCHMRNMMLVDGGQLGPIAKVLLAPAYLLAGGGHLAVVIFFVLSGYLISGSVLSGFKRGNFSFPIYASHRTLRLWVVLIPSLFVGGLLDKVGMSLHRAVPLYSGLVANHETSTNFFHHLTWKAFVQTMAFMQTLHGMVFGTNVPLWSIAYEFWYYALFPLAFVVFYKGYPRQRKWLAGMLFLLICAIVGKDVIFMFPLWLMGAAIHWLPEINVRHAGRVWASLGYGVVFAAAITATRMQAFAHLSYVVDFTVGLATTGLLCVLLTSRDKAESSAYTWAAKTFAGFSYTLYTIHFPILMLLTGYFLGSSRWVPTPLHLLALAGILVLILGVAKGMHELFEAHTPMIQKWVATRIKGDRPPKSAEQAALISHV
jgi:peptidoglycan/LPS O-acetylase OafA/YrhL